MDGILLHKTRKELQQKLKGAFITKIYQPSSQVFHFEFRQQQTINLYLFLMPSTQGLFISSYRLTNPPTPPPLIMLLRKYLQGKVLQDISQPGLERLIKFHFPPFYLVAELMGRHANLVLLRDDQVLGVHKPQGQDSSRPLTPGMSYTFPPQQDKMDPATITEKDLFHSLQAHESTPLWRFYFQNLMGVGPRTAREMAHRGELNPETPIDALQAEEHSRVGQGLLWLQEVLTSSQTQPTLLWKGSTPWEVFPFNPIGWPDFKREHFSSLSSMFEQAYLLQWQKQQIEQEQQRLNNAVKKEMGKQKKKISHLLDDYRKGKNYEELRIKGELLSAYAHAVKKGMDSVTLPNFYDEETPMEIQLKPHLTPHGNAQHYFKQYHKRKKSLKYINREYAKTQRHIQYLEQVQHFIQQADTKEVLEEIKEELIDTGVYRIQKKKKKNQKKAAEKPRTLVGPQGHTILIGRNNRQNDELLRQAKSQDIWLHAREMPGSHVIIKIDQKNCSNETLLFGAQLAAYYSKGRSSSKIPVDYTRVKDVRKPKGAPPGYVFYENFKTLLVSPQDCINGEEHKTTHK